jgi:hypothetical protein
MLGVLSGLAHIGLLLVSPAQAGVYRVDQEDRADAAWCGDTARQPVTESERQKETSMKIALLLKRLGLTSTLLHSLGAASIAGSLSLWGRSAAVSNRDAKARAERLAIFVGLWPPTFFLLGKVLQDLEATPEEQVEQARLREAA